MRKWIASALASVCGGVVGLIISGRYTMMKFYHQGAEVDLSDTAALAKAFEDSPQSRTWTTYFVFDRDIVIALPGFHWSITIPVVFAFLFFVISFSLIHFAARQKTRPEDVYAESDAAADKFPRLSGTYQVKTTAESIILHSAEDKIAPESKQSELLRKEIWRTHYDYNDSVRRVFDQLTEKDQKLGIRFAELFLQNPEDAHLSKLAAQALGEEQERRRFSKNEKVEAAHKAMSTISEDAAAEFRRVIGIIGEDVDLDEITQKIRNRFSMTSANRLVEHQLGLTDGVENMTALDIIEELQGMGIKVDAYADGPYFIKRSHGGRDRLRDIQELRAFLQRERKKKAG